MLNPEKDKSYTTVVNIEVTLPESLQKVEDSRNNVECTLGGCKGILRYGTLPQGQYFWSPYKITLSGLFGWTCSKCGAKLMRTEVSDIAKAEWISYLQDNVLGFWVFSDVLLKRLFTHTPAHVFFNPVP